MVYMQITTQIILINGVKVKTLSMKKVNIMRVNKATSTTNMLFQQYHSMKICSQGGLSRGVGGGGVGS